MPVFLSLARTSQQLIRSVLAVRMQTAIILWDDAVERLHAKKQSYMDTERESGLEVGEEWAKEDPKYRQLLRIAKAAEEARREIFDPEHQMDPGDWVRFWEDRGLGGDTDAWVRTFANRAARLSRKPGHAGQLD
jgi:hypothetical protein